MKKTALPIALLAALALSACGEKPASDAPAPAAGAPAAEAPAAAKPGRAAKPATLLATPLPQGVELTFPYHLRSDRVVASPNGKARRLVRIDALDTDVRAARKAVAADLRAAGFRATVQAKDLPKTDGPAQQVYIKKGWKGTVVVTVAPIEKKAGRGKAGATVTFGWQGDGIGPAPAAAPGTTDVPADGAAAGA